MVAMIDDIDGLMEYSDDIPEDHDSKDYDTWYWENKNRIVSELLKHSYYGFQVVV